jgi:hypothetical protein
MPKDTGFCYAVGEGGFVQAQLFQMLMPRIFQKRRRSDSVFTMQAGGSTVRSTCVCAICFRVVSPLACVPAVVGHPALLKIELFKINAWHPPYLPALFHLYRAPVLRTVSVQRLRLVCHNKENFLIIDKK